MFELLRSLFSARLALVLLLAVFYNCLLRPLLLGFSVKGRAGAGV